MEGKGSGPQRRGPLFRFLAATLLVVMYAVSMLGVSGFALTAGSASAEARSRGGGRGRGRGRGRSRGRGRGGIFFGGALIGGGVGVLHLLEQPVRGLLRLGWQRLLPLHARTRLLSETEPCSALWNGRASRPFFLKCATRRPAKGIL